jgi:hypothetical protein
VTRTRFMGVVGLVGLFLLLAATASAIDNAISTVEHSRQVVEVAP